MKQNTFKIAELAIFIAVAFLFSYIESLFPLPLPFPGMKLGLANLVILIALYRFDFKDAFFISVVRNILNAITFGNLFGFFYSFAGSIFSLLMMATLKKINHPQLSIISISAVGGIVHNLGQFVIAALLVGGSSILPYLPFLYFAGLVAGVLIGVLAKLCLSRLPETLFSSRS